MKLIIGAVLLGAVMASCAPRTAGPSSTATPTATAATVAAATMTPASTPTSPASSTVQPATTGTITGLAGYPSEGHPGLSIYAFSKTDRSVYFSVDIPRSTDPTMPSYTIAGVRPGTYNLFSYAAGNDRAGGAYTEYVRCGLRASCSDHSLIDVTVRAGETVRDIDVRDWYGPTESFPPRPR